MSDIYPGKRSKRELFGVHPECILVVGATYVISPVDFAVVDGLRTEAEQEENVRRGVSRTMRSYHLPQPPEHGFPLAWAVDLVPYVNGRPRWEWDPIYGLAGAVHKAATQLRIPLTWGAVWDRPFLELDPENLEAEVTAYVKRRRQLGKSAFLDGPHFQRNPD